MAKKRAGHMGDYADVDWKVLRKIDEYVVRKFAEERAMINGNPTYRLPPRVQMGRLSYQRRSPRGTVKSPA